MDNDKYIGRLLDNRYEILEVIGVGGMAVVYKARCHRLNRLVAIKILKDEFSQDSDFRDRFHAEGQAVAMLSHPNIVSVYDVSVADDADYIVMELIDGISLKQYMEKKGVLNWKETLHFAMQIGKALEHAHSRGIVHRDIKPHNVMVLKNGSVKVADFGIARIMSKSNTLTKEALGSVHYISPEQAKGGWVDNRSDIYSLGVVMYEMLAGRPPYDGDSPVAVAIQHINGGALLPTTFNPNIPSGLEQIIMKAMCQDPAQRYLTATAMLYDMDELRKNPVMLFDFQDVPVDDATRLPAGITTQPIAAEKKPAPVASAPKSAPRVSDAQRASARRSRAAQRREAENNRVATIAIVTCSIVAVVAIVIFMVMLFSDWNVPTGPMQVDVPQLQGDLYQEVWDDYPSFTIVVGESVYSDEYKKGQIISQSPKAGTQQPIGTTITVKVSLGKEPEPEIPMLNVVGISAADAQTALDDLKFGLQVLVQEEHSETVPTGQVIRTEPAADEILRQGQAVYVYVSKGTAIQKVQMPNVIGYLESIAKMTLAGQGLANVEVIPVESEDNIGKIIFQSVEAKQMVDKNEKIVLHLAVPISKPTEPTQDSTQDTSPSDPEVTMNVLFYLPEGWEVSYVLRITTFDDQQVVLEDTVIQPGQTEIRLRLTGRGVVKYKIYIDDELYRVEEVDYTVNG